MGLNRNQECFASDIRALQSRLTALGVKHGLTGTGFRTISINDSTLVTNYGTVNVSKWTSGSSLDLGAINLALRNETIISEVPHLLWAFMDKVIAQAAGRVLSYSIAGTSQAAAKQYYNAFVLRNTPLTPIFATLSAQISKLETVAPCECYCNCYCVVVCECNSCDSCDSCDGCQSSGCPGGPSDLH